MKCVCVCVCVSLDDPDDRLADRDQLLLRRGRTELLWEESGVGPGPTEGDGCDVVSQCGCKPAVRQCWFLILYLLSGVAVHPLRVLRGREQHPTGEEISEEKFTGRQSDFCSAAQGEPAAPRSHVKKLSKNIDEIKNQK